MVELTDIRLYSTVNKSKPDSMPPPAPAKGEWREGALPTWKSSPAYKAGNLGRTGEPDNIPGPSAVIGTLVRRACLSAIAKQGMLRPSKRAP